MDDVGGTRRIGTMLIRSARNINFQNVTAQSVRQTTGTGTNIIPGVINTTSATGIDITTTNIVVNNLVTAIVDPLMADSARGIVRLQATASTASANTSIITMLDPGRIIASNDVTLRGNRDVVPAILFYEATPARPDLTPQTHDFISTTNASADVLIESSINFFSPGETANNNFIINTTASTGNVQLATAPITVGGALTLAATTINLAASTGLTAGGNIAVTAGSGNFTQAAIAPITSSSNTTSAIAITVNSTRNAGLGRLNADAGTLTVTPGGSGSMTDNNNTPTVGINLSAKNVFSTITISDILVSEGVLDLVFRTPAGYSGYWLVCGIDLATSVVGLPTTAPQRLDGLTFDEHGLEETSTARLSSAKRAGHLLTARITTGLTPGQILALQNATVQISDLNPEGAFGLAGTRLILLDDDALGFGWHVCSGPVPTGNVDLGTDMCHELGHILG